MSVLENMTEDEYRNGALSASGMKYLLKSPKQYRHYMDNRGSKPEFDFGHAVHADVLGVGSQLVEIPDDLLSGVNRSISSNEAKAWVAAQREAGTIPLKADVIAQVKACADSVRANPKAAWLLGLPGESEVAFEAVDPLTGVTIRSRLDRLATLPDGRKINIDLKTSEDVRLMKLRFKIEDYCYDVQSEVYKWQIGMAYQTDHIAPTHLIFVQTEAPYEVRTIQLAHEDWINGGRVKMRRAINTYAACIASGHWPGADDDEGPAEILTPRGWYLDDLALEAN